MTHATPPPWTATDVDRFGGAEEIQISTRRKDGTLRPFVPVWIVAVDGALYVRSYRGADGSYRQAAARPVGAIRVGAHLTDVTFATAAEDVRDAVDKQYRSKYARYSNSYLQPMLADTAVAATVRLDPQV